MMVGKTSELAGMGLGQKVAQSNAQEGPASDDNAISESAHERSQAKVMAIMATLCTVVFIAALDATIIATAAPTIAKDFDSSATYVWTGSAYLLASAVSTPVLARFSDVWGRKPLISLANILFFVGSLLSAAAPVMSMHLVGRTLQGIGCGGIVVLVQIIISDIFSERRRAAYLAIIEVVFALSLALGPIVGGAFTEKVSWRWCFYINLPFGGIAFVAIIYFLDLNTPKTTFKEGVAIIDWPGVFLVASGTLLLLFGMEFGGTTLSWNSAVTISLLTSGAFTLVLFVMFEWRFAKSPLIPMHVFRSVSSSATLAIVFLHGLVLMSAAYFLPLYFQASLSAEPLYSGVYYLPTTIATSTASVATGIFIRKTGNYLWPIVTGLALMTLGFGLFISFNSDSSWAKIIIYQIIAGIGVGPNFQALLVALQSQVSVYEIASATATLNFLRNISAAISIVVGGSVFQNRIGAQQGMLQQILGPESARMLSGSDAGADVPLIRQLPEVQRKAAQSAYSQSLSTMWILYAAISGAALFLSIFVKQIVLRTDHEELGTGLSTEMKRAELVKQRRRGK